MKGCAGVNFDGPAQTDESSQFYNGEKIFNLSSRTVFHADV